MEHEIANVIFGQMSFLGWNQQKIATSKNIVERLLSLQWMHNKR
jgi:hypothetical protein